MTRLRISIIVLLLVTGIFLNIERLDIGSTENFVNLQSFVYLLLGAAIFTTLLIPGEWNVSSVLLVTIWSVIYFAGKLIFFRTRPLVGGIYTFLSITELDILILTVLLTLRVSRNLYAVEETLSTVTLADVSNRVKKLEDAGESITKEFVRSRRYNRPLSIIVVDIKEEQIDANLTQVKEEIINMMVSRYTMSSLLRVIDKEIRRPDLILEQRKQNRMIILLPETDSRDIQPVANNIRSLTKSTLGSAFNIGTASFPDDAYTFDELVEMAEIRFEKNSKVLIPEEVSPEIGS